MKRTKLTIQQEKFVSELIKGKSQREAYKVAYPKSRNWADNSIDVNASKLFSNTKVQLRYNELNTKLVKKLEDEGIITATEIVRELKSIAMDDISNYLSFRTAKTIVGYDDNGEPIVDYGIIVDVKDSDTINTKNISEISVGKDGQFKFKLYCRDNALIQLGKSIGMFTDKVEHSGSMNINNPYEGLTTEELKKLISND